MKYNSRSITLKIDTERKFNTKHHSSITSYDEGQTSLKAKALSILIEGAYNQHGRNIPSDEYEKVQKDCDVAISNMMYLLKKYA